MTVKESVLQLIAENTRGSAPIHDKADLFTDLGLDSFSFIALLTKIEEAHGITFAIEEMEPCLEVGRLIKATESKVESATRGRIRHALLGREDGKALGVIDGERRLSYDDLAQRAAAIQGLLPKGQREHVAILLPNGADYIAALWGVFMAGMTAFPLSTGLTAHEIGSLLAQASARTLISSKAYGPLLESVAEAMPLTILYVEALPEPGPELPPQAAFPITDENEPMVLLATSGTTGKAKLVQLSERNVLSSTLAYLDKMDYEKFQGEELRVVLGTPFSSSYGLLVLSAYLIKAIPIVVMKEGFTLDALYRAIQEHRITHYEGGVFVGVLMEQMIGRPIPYDIRSLKYLGLAGSKISAASLRHLMEAYPGVEFWPGYGMTEAGPLIAKPDKRVNMEKLDAVGTRIPCMAIKVEVDGSLTDAPYVKGEVAVRGPNVMLGYYENEEETRQILRDGYLYTGDIGYLDEEGYLYICGRKKNVIIVRGFNVHAEEVEACLMSSGLAKDCFVYGQADPLGGETVCADIIPMTPEVTAQDIRAHCQEHLAGYKQPETIHLVDSIKKTATGKTERA